MKALPVGIVGGAASIVVKVLGSHGREECMGPLPFGALET